MDGTVRNRWQGQRDLKIAFLIATTGRGGAERVAATLCNEWVRSGHDVSMVTFEAPETSPSYELAPGVQVVSLNLLGESRSMIGSMIATARRVRRVRAALRSLRPDVVVAFMTETNVIAVLAGIGARWKTVISERIHPAYHPVGWSKAMMRKFTYRWANNICVQTADIAYWFHESMGVEATVIPNPVNLDLFPSRPRASGESGQAKRLVAMGRLDPQKGFDLLIEAFAEIRSSHPDWRLIIHGEGDERKNLELQISSLGVEDSVALPGETDEPRRVLAEADAVVHSARYEGSPNVVVEALASSRAVLATDCPGGTRELSADGTFLVLAPANDAAGLTKSLDDFLGDDGQRQALEGRAREAVMQLAVQPIAGRWIDLIKHTMAH